MTKIKDPKSLPHQFLLRIIQKAKDYLKNDEVMTKICKEYNLNTDIIDLIPTAFSDLDVSAQTRHGVVYLNYKLLEDGDFYKDYGYLIHEYQHWFDQTFGDEPTQSSDDGNYLDNPFEEKAFQGQIEYLANEHGEKEAERYVDHLLDHHNVGENKKEDKKDTLMAKV